MPAFMFEKISPPDHGVPAPGTAANKQRGIVRQILHRVAEARVKRIQRDKTESPATISRQQTPSD